MNLFFSNRFLFQHIGEPFLKRRGIRLNLLPIHHPSQIELFRHDQKSPYLEMGEEEFVMRARKLLPRHSVSNYLIQGYFEKNSDLIQKPRSIEHQCVSDIFMMRRYVRIVFLSLMRPQVWELVEKEKRGWCERYYNRVPHGGFKIGYGWNQIRIYPHLCRSVLVVDFEDLHNPRIVRSEEWFSGVNENVIPQTVIGYIDTSETRETF